MSDDRPCNMKGIGTVHIKMIDGMVQELKEVGYIPQLKKNLISVGIVTVQIKMFDGMVQELKEVRYVLQLKRNLISVGTLKTLGLSIRDVLKMTKDSMVILKGVC